MSKKKKNKKNKEKVLEWTVNLFQSVCMCMFASVTLVVGQ